MSDHFLGLVLKGLRGSQGTIFNTHLIYADTLDRFLKISTLNPFHLELKELDVESTTVGIEKGIEALEVKPVGNTLAANEPLPVAEYSFTLVKNEVT